MTRRGRTRHALLAGCLLLGGCVYYNGMYNTNRLAKAARKAEREGRQFEATNLWGQVVTRADSLVFRHPQSKYADQAIVIRGLALARLNQCPDAVGPLGRLGLVELPADLGEEAALALGRCQLELGDAGLADLAFARVLNSPDSARRHEARFRHARALRMTGRYDEALALLAESPDPRSREDLLLSLAGAGRGQDALAFADSILAGKDSTFVWDSAVVALARTDPRAASALVDRLNGESRFSPDVRARRLYEDGARLAAIDSARALARFQLAAREPGQPEFAQRAQVRLLSVALSAARTPEDLGPVADSLAKLGSLPGGAAVEATAVRAHVTRIRQLSDSARPDAPRGDLRGFLAAEVARDSLGAPLLATYLFRRLADDWPASPYAPKALLAAELLDPSESDSTRARLDSLYRDSPYLARVRGEDAPGYRELEDSLEAFAAAPPPVAPRRGAPGARPRGVIDDNAPRRRGVAPDDAGTPRPPRPAPPPAQGTPKPRRGLEP